MSLFNDDIEVWRAPLVEDAYGRKRDWDAATRVWAGKGAVVPYRHTKKVEPSTRETSERSATVYLPGTVGVDSADFIRFHNQYWTLEGDAWLWALGSRRYTMLDIKRVTK
ncbi:hypothetical protein [Streptomyces sp. NPDC048489]|uniref:hypothetical protein n=1 Tax=Streptomyces sp. NPDC048489 TaxID=3154504 RepID=UPI00341DF0C1